MKRSGYDHGKHAGNAGDVWKHFILAETIDHLCADHILSGRRELHYLESHAGHPEYCLGPSGQWLDGIGRLWDHLPEIRRFMYFDVLADLNPNRLEIYPGSIRLALEIAGRCGLDLDVEAWDTDQRVALEWEKWPDISFHSGDGFFGAGCALYRHSSGLLLIDPPYTDSRDAKEAHDLFLKARELEWTVLIWSMDGNIKAPDPSPGLEDLTLRFTDAGMDGGRFKCTTMTLYSPDRCLAQKLKNRSIELIEAIHL